MSDESGEDEIIEVVEAMIRGRLALTDAQAFWEALKSEARAAVEKAWLDAHPGWVLEVEGA